MSGGPGPSGALTQQASYERIYRESGIRDAGPFYRWVLRLMRVSPSSRLLDVACGEGDLVAAAAGTALEAYGVDISPMALSLARQRHGALRVAVADAERLPFPDACFDAVACLGSLENFGDPLRGLAEMWRVLKPGGTFCALMPNKFWLGDILQVAVGQEESVPFQRFERVATAGQWRQMLASAGFRVRRMRGYVKTSPLVQGGKVRSFRKWLITHVLAAVAPASLAWSVAFVSEKIDRPDQPGTSWVWSAEWLNPAPPSPS